MKLTLISLMLILATVAIYGEPQFYYPGNYPGNYYSNYFRSGGESNPWIPQYLPRQKQQQQPLAQSVESSVATNPGSSAFQPDPSDGRFLFWQMASTGYTLTLSTSTATAISTVFTTCTTSTTALVTCTAGRRRRGLFYDESEATGRARRGLFYNEKEAEAADDIFVYASIELNQTRIYSVRNTFLIHFFFCSTVLSLKKSQSLKIRKRNRIEAHDRLDSFQTISCLVTSKNGTI